MKIIYYSYMHNITIDQSKETFKLKSLSSVDKKKTTTKWKNNESIE